MRSPLLKQSCVLKLRGVTIKQRWLYPWQMKLLNEQLKHSHADGARWEVEA